MVVLAVALAGVLEAQPRPASITPAPEVGAGRARGTGYGFGRGFGRGWMVWPWGWWGMREERPLPKPVDPEPPARAWVVNEDYRPALLNPQTTEYAEGELPPPRMEAERRVERIAPCRLRLNSGEAVEARWCEWRADSVRFEDADGRRVRLSPDLVDWRGSDRPTF